MVQIILLLPYLFKLRFSAKILTHRIMFILNYRVLKFFLNFGYDNHRLIRLVFTGLSIMSLENDFYGIINEF